MTFPDLSKPLDKMTKQELRLVIARKDEELAVLRNRLVRYGSPEATTAQLSAATALMDEVIHAQRRTT